MISPCKHKSPGGLAAGRAWCPDCGAWAFSLGREVRKKWIYPRGHDSALDDWVLAQAWIKRHTEGNRDD